jgi:hypothetical protein
MDTYTQPASNIPIEASKKQGDQIGRLFAYGVSVYFG